MGAGFVKVVLTFSFEFQTRSTELHNEEPGQLLLSLLHMTIHNLNELFL